MLNQVPAELRDLKQWVAFRLVQREAGKKPTKVPYCTASRPASTTDASTWLTLEAAQALAISESMAGVGFVFSADDPYAGIDLDECRDASTGVIQPWAQRLIERLASYTEVSPSGTGIHIIVRAKLPGGGRKQSRPGGTGAVEVYDQKRYFTVTGQIVPETPATIGTNQDVVADIYARLKDDTPAALESSATPTGALSAEDDGLVARIEASRESPAFHRLYSAGETRPNRTASENDLELATILCRYAAEDAQVERIMRASPLRREKWDRKGDDYLKRTILTARRKTGTTAGAATADAGFVDFGQVHDSPPPAVGWLVDSIWPEGARGWIAGEAKLGKSWLALELAVCVAAGVPFLEEFEVKQSGLVFYLTEESNLRNVYNRLRMILLAKDLSPDVLRDKLRLLVRKRVKLTDPSWRTRILTAIDRDKPVMLFLDPLRRYHDGGENDSTDLVAVLDAAAEFQERATFHVAIPIVHHMRKASEANSESRAGQQLRGSSDLHAWGDAALYCSGTSEDKNAIEVEVELKDAQAPDKFVVGITYGDPQKIMIGPDATEMRPARLAVRAGQTSKEDIKVNAAAERIFTFLKAQDSPRKVGEIKGAVPGRDKWIAPALALLKRLGKADYEDGPRRAQLWTVTSAQTAIPIQEQPPLVDADHNHF